MSIESNRLPLFTPVADNTYQVVAGGPGWVDTDMSAVLPAGKLIVFLMNNPSAGIGAGARRVGETINPVYTNVNGSYNPHVAVSDNQHLELYQAAGGINNYHVLGYMR